MATNRKENPTLAAHVAEASGAEREIESHLAAHLLLVNRSKHQARLERQLESAKARVKSLDSRLKELGGSIAQHPQAVQAGEAGQGRGQVGRAPRHQDRRPAPPRRSATRASCVACSKPPATSRRRR